MKHTGDRVNSSKCKGVVINTGQLLLHPFKMWKNMQKTDQFL